MISLALLILCSASIRAETVDRIVATVNGDIILYSELKERLQLMGKVSPEMKTDDPARRAQIEREVLQLLIRERLTEGEVKRLKISVASHEVDSAIADIKRDNGITDAQFEYLLSQKGQTVEQFRDGIRKEMERGRLLDRVLKSKTVITEDQIDARLKSEKITETNRRRIAVIFLPGAEGSESKGNDGAEKLAREIHERLKGGADFAQMARQYSKGPAAAEGGDIGYMATDELAPAMADAIRGLKQNGLSNIVRGAGGYYLLKVIDDKKEKPDKSEGSIREKARKQLFQQEVNRKFDEWIRDLEARAFVNICL